MEAIGFISSPSPSPIEPGDFSRIDSFFSQSLSLSLYHFFVRWMNDESVGVFLSSIVDAHHRRRVDLSDYITRKRRWDFVFFFLQFFLFFRELSESQRKIEAKENKTKTKKTKMTMCGALRLIFGWDHETTNKPFFKSGLIIVFVSTVPVKRIPLVIDRLFFFCSFIFFSLHHFPPFSFLTNSPVSVLAVHVSLGSFFLPEPSLFSPPPCLSASSNHQTVGYHHHHHHYYKLY